MRRTIPEIIALTQGESATNAIKSVAEDKAKVTLLVFIPKKALVLSFCRVALAIVNCTSKSMFCSVS